MMFSDRCSIWPILEFSLLGLVHLWLQLVFSLARGDLGSAVLSREWWRGLKVGHLRPPPPLSRELAAQSSMGGRSTIHTSGLQYILLVHLTYFGSTIHVLLVHHTHILIHHILWPPLHCLHRLWLASRQRYNKWPKSLKAR